MSIKKRLLSICMLIGLCFFWTGSGYLTWMYRLLDYYPADMVDWLTEVIGYLFQIIGLALFAYAVKKDYSRFMKWGFFLGIVLSDMLFITLSALAPTGISALIFGYIMNLLHGITAGFYLTKIVTDIPQQYSGIVFGAGYGIGSIGSWLLSLIGDGNFLQSPYVLPIYGILVAASVIFFYLGTDAFAASASNTNLSDNTPSSSFLLLCGFVIFLLSAVKNTGFYFPLADLTDSSISLEFTRVFYAIGLITAGFINDKNRKWGAICCIAALVFPFSLLALQSNADISAIVWIIGYIFFGFFSVYRILLFTDLARKSSSLLYLAGFGLMWGRAGDAVGALAGILTTEHVLLLIVGASLAFIVTVFAFFALYQKLYLDSASEEPTLDFQLSHFAQNYGLTPREAEVFSLIFDGRSNGEIAADLYISENTVKFHVKNILKKTNCSNRNSLLSLFNG